MLGSLGVLAGELVLVFLAGDEVEVLEDLLAGELEVRNGGREARSSLSSDFFRPPELASKEFDAV